MAASSSSSPPTAATPPLPKLRLEIRDLVHPGAGVFLRNADAAAVLAKGIADIYSLLYPSTAAASTTTAASAFVSTPPPTRSVTLVLRDMGGVAYTTGSDLDDDHKEIHFSLGYIEGTAASGLAAAEIAGVLTHELVHCYQWNGRGTCPGGLIEGIADWVRLRAALGPPHWRRTTHGEWDGGYEHTAYFLEYLERRFGAGTVRRINEALRTHEYDEKPFWTGLLGRPVEQLWHDYVKAEGGKVKEGEEEEEEEEGGEECK